MAQWTHNGPCFKCGSRDNLGHWDDGSVFCWGCHYYEKATHPVFKPREREKETEALKYTLPDDLSTDFSEEVVAWLQQYRIDIPTAISNGFRYSRVLDQLVFTISGGSGETIFWQARNFRKGSKRKYFNGGDPKDILPLYGETSNRVVIVEDIVSAVRIASQAASMPLFGSYLPVEKLNRLARLYSSLVVWLDSDKWKEAVGIADKAKLMGIEAKAVFTELDPKYYSDSEILEILK